MARSTVHSLRPPAADATGTVPLRRVFVRDLIATARIGVHRHEKKAPQRVRINIELLVPEDGRPLNDRLANVVDYEAIVVGVRTLTSEGHVNLVETLAERIAALCLRDRRVHAARVRVEKLEVFADAASVGIEIERHNG
ncbi:dihydroneopterin aldolase [Vineibacter terrae]|uniref:dihydroneopterin aldolase n=1 Tax=Vineibacter terrae TaxID=2586908 RepID=UPI002E32CE68|nr:dihydroneopterin aldolase [Vineibacter terrae]HEX2885799.1 dihydroneopterin aldolase [Vineibacter terrae]